MKEIKTGTWYITQSEIEFSNRYNGGWVKEVKGIDKTKTNGYSLIGDFKKDGGDTYEIGHLYLDCSITGSRKHHVKNYRLFFIQEDGVPGIYDEILDGGADWAVNFWDAIETFLNKVPESPLKSFSDEYLIKELESRGFKLQIEEV